jgi:L-ascorbate metabolism protein UlaG (beta-lactamase superfamily)
VSPRHVLASALTSLLVAASCTSATSSSSSSSSPPTGASGSAATSAPPPGSTGAATSAPAPSSAPAGAASSNAASAADTIATSAGEVRITPVYHATVVFQHAGKVIVVDPWSKGALDKIPKADLILITDIHFDHLDKDAIGKVKKDGTVILGPAAVAAELPGTKTLKNGEKTTFESVGIEAVPMYNKVRGPEAGKLFHDKGRGNGYVLTFGDKRVYLSGDTECIDEMKALQNIDVAFVCMNLPYTMPPAEAASCVKAFKPKVLYPYHYKDSNLDELTKALADEKGVEVRLRNWYP